MVRSEESLRGRIFQSPWAMVAAALALRLVAMGFTYKMQLDPSQDHWAFGWETGKVARSIATGRGFSSPYTEPTGPTALIPPVYTYLVAGVFKLFGIYTASSALVLLTLNNLFLFFDVSANLFDCPQGFWAPRSGLGRMGLGYFSLLDSPLEYCDLGNQLDHDAVEPGIAGDAVPREVKPPYRLGGLRIVVGPHGPRPARQRFPSCRFLEVGFGFDIGGAGVTSQARLSWLPLSFSP